MIHFRVIQCNRKVDATIVLPRFSSILLDLRLAIWKKTGIPWCWKGRCQILSRRICSGDDSALSQMPLNPTKKNTTNEDCKQKKEENGESHIVMTPHFSSVFLPLNTAEDHLPISTILQLEEGGEENKGETREEGGEENKGETREEGGEENKGETREEGGEENKGETREEEGEENKGETREEEGEENKGETREEEGEENKGETREEEGEENKGETREEEGEENKGETRKNKGETRKNTIINLHLSENQKVLQYGCTYLHIASMENGMIEAVKFCIEDFDGSSSNEDFDGSSSKDERKYHDKKVSSSFNQKKSSFFSFLDKKDDYEETPLYVSASFGQKEALETLIGVGANCNVTNVYYWTPLFCLVANDDIEGIELMSQGAAATHQFSEPNGGTAENALYKAASHLKIRAACKLLECGSFFEGEFRIASLEMNNLLELVGVIFLDEKEK